MNYTINIKIKDSNRFDAFLLFLKSFDLAEITEIRKDNVIIEDKLPEKLISIQKNNKNPNEYYGLWENRNIPNVKQFRESLWQRTK